MKKILYIAPHLSTGGLPQYLYRKIKEVSKELEVHCIEFENITGGKFIVQRKRIEDFLNDRFYSIGEDKEEFFRIVEMVNPDFIHLEEIPEYFLPTDMADRLYAENRNYKIFETSHDSSFDPDKGKRYLPDAFFFVSQWQINQYRNIDVPKYLAEYPIEYRQRPDRKEGLKRLGLDPNKKHVLNVGLFTPRKNQSELFEVAERFDDSVQFHFLGNQADNFKSYWEPLLNKKPSNCVVWGERADTEAFYSCMDAFYFASRGNEGDKETMPLVLKEAIGWGMPVLLHNLDVYLGYFDKFDSVKYLGNRNQENAEILASVISEKTIAIDVASKKEFDTWYEPENNKFHLRFLDSDKLSGMKLDVVLADNWNNLTSYCFETEYAKGGAVWFVTNGWPTHFNGFRVDIYQKGGQLVFSKVVHDFGREEKIGPKVNGESIQMSHEATDHSSWYTFYEVFMKEDYSDIRKGDVVVDIGANLGYVSLYAINKGASRVFSIEPDPVNFRHLCANVKDHGEITPIQYAISDTRGEIDFYQGEASSIATTYKVNENLSTFNYSTGGIKVKSIDPNSLFSELGLNRIDYLKIDCEGAEFEFFKSIDEKFLSDNIRRIRCEVHAFAGSQHEYQKHIKAKLMRCGFEVTEDNSLDTNSVLLFKAVRRPKIKVVHLLNQPEQERESKSIESLKGLEEYGIRYEQVITPLYTETPPRENCNRPESVSDHPGEYLLGPGHYGCYLAHRKGILEGLSDDVDAILLNECDSMLQFDHRQVAEKVYEAYESAVANDLAYVSFGKRIPDYPHERIGEETYATDKLSEAHCILIPKCKHEYFKRKFESCPWDVSDLWYNVFITEFRKGIFSRPYSLQAPGTSNIDLKYKDGFILHEPNSLPSNFENNDITVIVQTCDEYEFLWEGWYLSFKDNWDWSLGWPVLFCSESKTPKFKDSRIEVMNTSKSSNASGFSDRLTEILERVETKYVLYIQDDMWLKGKVEGDTLKECLYLMKHHGWNSVKVHQKIWFNYRLEKTGTFAKGKRILKYSPDSEYLLTHNSAIWDREFLLRSMAPNENPWENERSGTERIRNAGGDPKIYHCELNWYYPIGIQNGGRFTEFGEETNRQLIASERLKAEFDI